MADLTPAQQERINFVNQYNRGSSAKSRERQNVPGGTAIGLLYVQLDILTPEEKLLSAEEVNTLLTTKLANIENTMETNLPWLDKAKYFAYYLVPASVPGEEFEPSFIDREWRLIAEFVGTTDSLRFQASSTRVVPANEVVAIAAIRLTQTFHGQDHANLMASLISSYAVVDDIDLFGQVILPTAATDFALRVEARLRCDGVQEIPPDPEWPVLP